MGESHAVLIEENARLRAKLEEAEKARDHWREQHDNLAQKHSTEQQRACLTEKERDELEAKLAEAESYIQELMPDAQKGTTWVYRNGPKYLHWLEEIAKLTNEPEGGEFYSGQRTLQRVKEMLAERDEALAKLAEAETRWHNRPVTCDREACSCIARLEIENKKLEAACAEYRKALEALEPLAARDRARRRKALEPSYLCADCVHPSGRLCKGAPKECYDGDNGVWSFQSRYFVRRELHCNRYFKEKPESIKRREDAIRVFDKEASALSANPAGAAMLEVVKAAEISFPCTDERCHEGGPCRYDPLVEDVCRAVRKRKGE